MVRFQIQRPTATQLFYYQPGDYSKIRCCSVTAFPGFNYKTDRIAGIVSYGKRVNCNPSEVEAAARLKLNQLCFFEIFFSFAANLMACNYRR